MKKYLAKMIIVLLQVCVFFLAPLLFKVYNPSHVIVGMLIATFGLSMMIVVVSDAKIRYLYALIPPLMFIPSIPIYYNSSATESIIWYFGVSVGGVLLGFMIDKFIDVLYNRKKEK